MAVPFDMGRLESLGDNCELGFAMRRMGWEDGSLFRWASIRPESLLATMRGEFDRMYEFDDLLAHRTSMVLDTRYGTAWHSQMRSVMRDGCRMFVHDEAERRLIHAQETAKRAHLLAKLQRKFEHPNPVFVIKCNAGIDPSVLEGIHYQLYRRVVSAEFTLLEVCADPARAGSIEVVDRTRVRGFVSEFAGYDNAEAGDDESWRAVLAAALTRQRSARAACHSPGGFDPVILPFPETAEPRLDRVVLGDVRSGVARLLRGNEWCRLVDNDVFRLHAGQPGPAATAIVWSGLHLPPGAALRLRASCAVPESRDVRAALWLASVENRRAAQIEIFSGMVETTLEVGVPEGVTGPFTAWLAVEPVETLKPGERAVIDIQPVQAVPAKAAGSTAKVAA